MEAASRRPERREPGQSMVEFALALPLLLFLLFGVVEVGRLIFIHVAVSSASRDAARYGSAAGDGGGGGAQYRDCSGIRSAARRIGALANIQDSGISISYDKGPGTSALSLSCPPVSSQPVTLGDRVIVQVNAQYTPLIPIVSFPPITLSSVSRRTILKDVDVAGFSSATGGGAPSLPTVTIHPSDFEASEGSFGSREVEFRLSAPAGSTVIAPFSIDSSSTAAEGDDYSFGGSGQVEFSPGQTSKIISLSVVSDNLDEDDETIILALGTPINAQKGSADTFAARIIDDDDVEVSFASASQTLVEAAAAYSSPITVVLDKPSIYDVHVPYSTSGSATVGTDYSLSPGSVTIPRGSTQAIIFITIPGDDLDSIYEASEEGVLLLGAPDRGVLGSPDTHTVTLLDNDPKPAVKFIWPDQSVAETAGSMAVQVELSAVSSQDVTVPVGMGGTAVQDLDYNLLSSLTVSIPAGSTSAQINFAILNDALEEGDETIALSMGEPVNAVLGSPSMHVATITNVAPLPSVFFQSAGQARVESAGSLSVFIQVSAASSSPVTVPFSISGSAHQGSDYSLQPAGGQVVIQPGQATAEILIVLTDDILDEDGENIRLSLGAPLNAELGSPSIYDLYLEDDDTSIVSFASTGQSKREDLGSMTVLVQVSTPSSKEISVPYTITGTAWIGDDFTIPSSPLLIPAGGMSASIVIAMSDDHEVESDETVGLTLGVPANASLGAPATHTAVILDNDDLVCPTASSLKFYPSAKNFDLTLYNTNPGAAVVEISSMTVTWVAGNGKKFLSISFGGTPIWAGTSPEKNSSPSVISGSKWVSGADRKIYAVPPDDTKTLVFTFDYTINPAQAASYHVTINFNNPCPSITR